MLAGVVGERSEIQGIDLPDAGLPAQPAQDDIHLEEMIREILQRRDRRGPDRRQRAKGEKEEQDAIPAVLAGNRPPAHDGMERAMG